MPYAVNTRKGTIIDNEDIGKLPGGVAIPITPRQAEIAKHIVGVVVFDRVAGVSEEKARKKLYGIDKKTLEKKEELKTFQDFVKEYKDISVARKRWMEYKREKGIS